MLFEGDGETVDLNDGKKLTCVPNMAEGSQAMIDGQPAPDGDYTTSDGRVVTVSGGGITAVKPASGAAEMSEETKQELAKLKEAVGKVLELFTAQTEAITKLAENEKAAREKQAQEFKAQLGTQADAMVKIAELVKDISEKTVATATEQKKHEFKVDPEASLIPAHAREMEQRIANLKKNKA